MQAKNKNMNLKLMLFLIITFSNNIGINKSTDYIIYSSNELRQPSNGDILLQITKDSANHVELALINQSDKEISYYSQSGKPSVSILKFEQNNNKHIELNNDYGFCGTGYELFKLKPKQYISLNVNLSKYKLEHTRNLVFMVNLNGRKITSEPLNTDIDLNKYLKKTINFENLNSAKKEVGNVESLRRKFIGDPEEVEFVIEKAKIYHHYGFPEEAYKELEECIQINSQYYESYLMYGYYKLIESKQFTDHRRNELRKFAFDMLNKIPKMDKNHEIAIKLINRYNLK